MIKASFLSRPRGAGSVSALAALATALALLFVPVSRSEAQNRETPTDDGLYSCGKAKGPVSVSFKPDIELKDLITWAMGFTCKNFVFDSTITSRGKKVTIIAPKRMTSQQAWQVFLVSMQTMGLTVVPQGNVLRVVETAQAKTQALPIYRKGGPGATSDLVRVIVRPSHVSVDDLNVALGALKSADGQVTALPKSGILVVTDYGANIAKMRTFLSEVDQPASGERLYVIRVHNANASDLVAKLNEILGTGSSDGGGQRAPSRNRGSNSPDGGGATTSADSEGEAAIPSKLIADERTNSIILLASEPAYLRVRALVKRLDVALGAEGDGRIYVHYLENGDAEEIAATMNAVISGVSQPPSQGNSRRRGATPRPPQAPSGGGDSSAAFEGQVRLTHDKPTNSLVIIASPKDYFALRSVIERLDIPRRQVFIEAVILEVQTNSSLDLGTSFHGGAAVSDGGIVIGGLQHGNLQSIRPASLAGLSGLLGALLGPLLDESAALLGQSIPSYGVLFQALATSNNVNVLSSPHLLTTSNEEAMISVGQNIPYQSGFSTFATGQGGLGIPSQSVARQDVALTLKITPHVNESDMVRLEIDQEISDIAARNFEGLGPSWSKRTIQTTVVVRDQQSIVIGGLMADRTTYTESKIPLLGDIPLLGYLFKYSQKSKGKTNLLILLTPYIVKDQLDIDQIVRRKVRESNEFIRSFANFSAMRYDAGIDYRRKRGLIEEINHTLLSIERDAEELRQANMHLDEMPDGPIEYIDPGNDSSGEGDEGGEDGAVPGEGDSAPATQPSTTPSPAPAAAAPAASAPAASAKKPAAKSGKEK